MKCRHRHPPNSSLPAAASPAPVPVVLPQVLVQVHSDDHVVLTVDGLTLPGAPIRRAQLGAAFAQLATRLGSAFRVEIRESDGSVYADIISPPPPRSPFAPPADALPTPAQPRLIAFTVAGFAPGEDVALALVIRHTSASLDGSARAFLDTDETRSLPTTWC